MTPAERIGEAAGISRRQAECLHFISQGLTSKEIARRLNVSPSTVDNHVSSALARLGVRTRAEAVRLLKGGMPERWQEPVGELEAPVDAPDQMIGEPASWHLPELGGRRNTMPLTRRYIAVIQIALLGIMVLAAATFTIVGVVNLLSR
jgi:DNA-binding CsgD family transcriptional regulator